VLLTPPLFHPNFGGVPVAPDRPCWASTSAWALSYLAVKLLSKNSNLCDLGISSSAIECVSAVANFLSLNRSNQLCGFLLPSCTPWFQFVGHKFWCSQNYRRNHVYDTMSSK